jgi:hypothetical protein
MAIFSQKVVINMYIALTPGLKDLRSETFDRMGGGAVVIRVMKISKKTKDPRFCSPQCGQCL